jgi:hypothetical protein
VADDTPSISSLTFRSRRNCGTADLGMLREHCPANIQGVLRVVNGSVGFQTTTRRTDAL